MYSMNMKRALRAVRLPVVQIAKVRWMLLGSHHCDFSCVVIPEDLSCYNTSFA